MEKAIQEKINLSHTSKQLIDIISKQENTDTIYLLEEYIEYNVKNENWSVLAEDIKHLTEEDLDSIYVGDCVVCSFYKVGNENMFRVSAKKTENNEWNIEIIETLKAV